MNGRRILRLGWVILCEVFLFVSAVRILFPPDNIIVAIFAGMVCVATALGVILELLKHRLAIVLNVVAPMLAFVAMATFALWPQLLVVHGANGDVGEGAEGAGFLLIFSLVPLCLAMVTGIAYWAIDIAPDQHPTTLGLR